MKTILMIVLIFFWELASAKDAAEVELQEVLSVSEKIPNNLRESVDLTGIQSGKGNHLVLRRDFQIGPIFCKKGISLRKSQNLLVLSPTNRGPNQYCKFERFIFFGRGSFDNDLSPREISFGDIQKFLPNADAANLTLSNETIFYEDRERVKEYFRRIGLTKVDFLVLRSHVLVMEPIKFYETEFPRFSRIIFNKMALDDNPIVMGDSTSLVQDVQLPERKVVTVSKIKCSGKISFLAFSPRLDECTVAEDTRFFGDVEIPKETDISYYTEIRQKKSELFMTGPLSRQTVIRGLSFKKGLCVMFDETGHPSERLIDFGESGSPFDCPLNPKEKRPVAS